MAKIIKTNEQENALKTINGHLKVLDTMNHVLNLPESNRAYSITVCCGKDKTVFSVDKLQADGIVRDKRKHLASEVRALSKKYAIVLDEDDLAVLNNKQESEQAPKEAAWDPQEAETGKNGNTDSAGMDSIPANQDAEPEAPETGQEQTEPESPDLGYDSGFLGFGGM